MTRRSTPREIDHPVSARHSRSVHPRARAAHASFLSRRLPFLRRFFATLGPGLVTGAADDDPSGISTYSVAGAAFGYAPLWTALFTFPLMASVQLMCARLGMVTGAGLAAVIRRRYPTWVLWGACGLLLVANTINIAADLSGMADATSLVAPVPRGLGIPLFAIVLTCVLIWWSYGSLARLFKWLTLVLFAYVITAFLVHIDWPRVVVATLVPKIAWNRDFIETLVALFGTTISPYLFFWQAAQEVEEQHAACADGERPHRATTSELRASRTDVLTGMLASNVVMYFIILTTAATLHASGQTSVSTAREAAEALRPLAGRGAYWLFTLGLIGTGMLAVPVLAGSCAYAIGEAAAWRNASLAATPMAGRKFYAVMGLSMLVGLGLAFLRVSAVRLLFIAAVVNGLLAPPLIVIVILLTSRRDVMGSAVNPPLLRGLGWATFAVMTVAGLALFV